MANPYGEEAAEWLARALLDLRSAEILAKAEGPALVGCFLCQQAIEKLLKSVLVFHGQVPRGRTISSTFTVGWPSYPSMSAC